MRSISRSQTDVMRRFCMHTVDKIIHVTRTPEVFSIEQSKRVPQDKMYQSYGLGDFKGKVERREKTQRGIKLR